MSSIRDDSEASSAGLWTECGRPGVYLQGPVVWCAECYGRLAEHGKIPRVCEPWDKDDASPTERYEELFRAARTLWREGIEDERDIIPTLAFAARFFEMPGLETVRRELAQAHASGEAWGEARSRFRAAFDPLEVVRVVDEVPIIRSKPFRLTAVVYQETGLVEKVLIDVYQRSAKGEEIRERYDALMSLHGASYEGGQGNIGWQASAGHLRIVVQPRAPAALSSLHEGLNVLNPEEKEAPFPAPDIVADMCEALIGSVSKRRGNRGFSFALAGRDRGRPVSSDELIPAVVAWYVGGRGNVIKQHALKPTVARVLNEELLYPCEKMLFHKEGWDSGDYRWKLLDRIAQPVLRVDDEIRKGYFGAAGYIFTK